MKWISFFLPAILALALASCGGEQRTGNASDNPRDTLDTMRPILPDSLLIHPGLAVGGIRLQEADTALMQRYGTPDYSDAAMGKAVLLWYTDTTDGHPNTLSVFVSRDMGNDETARIRRIRVTSPLFETAKAIRTGSALPEITAAYTVTLRESYETGGTAYTVYDGADGIAFELDTTNHCVAIIVHAKEDTAATYLPMRGIQ